LYEEKEIEFMGTKIKMQVFSKKRIHDALEAAPAGSMMFISPKTYVIIGHVPEARKISEMRNECDEDCEKCNLFTGYGEEEDGC
jgi:hypothetical protein